MVLSAMKIVLLGGDQREIILAETLLEMGASVTLVGFSHKVVPPGAAVGRGIHSALYDADGLILPLSGTDEQGRVRTVQTGEELQLSEKALTGMHPGAFVLIGEARGFLKTWCKNHGFSLVEIGQMDELAILNSIATAEGAVQIAMQETDITLHGASCTVVGFGRVGMTLVRTLQALGAKVTVADRDAGKRARAQEMGCQTLSINELAQAAKNSEMIFNTVPALVLNREVLRCANPGLFVLDLASKPGGTDFSAATDFGVKAMLAPGLPGKVAPYSAGKVLGQVIVPIITAHQMDPKHQLSGE